MLPVCDDLPAAGTHVAASVGHAHIITLLLNNGAYPSVKDNFGRTPLYESVRNDHVACARILYMRGASIGDGETGDADQAAALHSDSPQDGGDMLVGAELCKAAFAGNTTFLRLMMEFGVDPNVCGACLAVSLSPPLKKLILPGWLLLPQLTPPSSAQTTTAAPRRTWRASPATRTRACSCTSMEPVRLRSPPSSSSWGGFFFPCQ